MSILLHRMDEYEIISEPSSFGALASARGNLPLAQLSYKTILLGLLVRTSIVQTYYNPFDEPIEATYVFPIEGNQSVVACEMRVADRTIVAEIKERTKARAEYQQAIRDGYRAALLEENRPETFSMKVGNIPPGEAIQVCIETVGALPLVHGEWTLRLPLVVAPRYTSGLPLPSRPVEGGTAWDTAQVPDASAVTPPTWLPGFPSPVHLRLEVEIDPQTLPVPQDWIGQLKSSLHTIALESDNSRIVRLRILPGEHVNRDFVLRGKVDDSILCSSVQTERLKRRNIATNEQATTIAVSIIPPSQSQSIPRDLYFLLDRSGSMSGWKIDAARRGISRLIDSLSSHDRFQLAVFDTSVDVYTQSSKPSRSFDSSWISATDSNRYQAVRWLAGISDRGGTEMGLAIDVALKAFLGKPDDNFARSSALVLVTDGQITGEDSLLRLLGKIPESKRPRIYCLGVDRAVNGSVLQRLTSFTNGTYELVESENRLDQVLQRFSSEMGAPVLTDVKLITGSEQVQWAPAQLSTLYSGRGITIYGRALTSKPLTVMVQGKHLDGSLWQQTLVSSEDGPQSSIPILEPLWAKQRIRELEDALFAKGDRDPRLTDSILNCSLSCQVLSRLTAFVAVDQTERITNGQMPHCTMQPVESPEGWKALFPTIPQSDLIPMRPRKLQSSENLNRTKSTQQETEYASKVGQTLVKRGIISSEQFDELMRCFQTKSMSIAETIDYFGYATPQEVAQAVAEVAGTRSVSLGQILIPDSVIQLLPESIAREFNVLPIAATADSLTVVMGNPNDLDTIEKLRFILNTNIVPVAGVESEINSAIDHHYGEIVGESADSMLQEFTDRQIDFIETDGDASSYILPTYYAAAPPAEMYAPSATPPGRKRSARSSDKFSKSERVSPETEAPIVRLTHLMISEAFTLKASHITILRQQGVSRVNFLVNGKWVAWGQPLGRLVRALVTRLKILGKLDIAELAYQTGEIPIVLGNNKIRLVLHVVGQDFLIEISPNLGGEPPELVRQWFETHQVGWI